MDSKLSASQLPQHHHLSSSSGSSFSSSTPASHYSDINDLAKTHVLKLDNGDNFSGGLGGSDGGGSETEGFVSGEEDFDASSERAFVRDTDEETVVEAIAGEDTHVKFVNSSEFFLPSSQRPIAKVSLDDEDDDDDDDEDDVGDSKFGDLRSGDVVRESFGDGRDLKIVGGENSVVENLGTKGGVLESEEEVLVETGPGKNANFGELVKENGVSDAQEPVVEALVGGEVNKALESSKFVEDVGSVVEGSSVPEKQLEVTEIENKKAVEPEQTDVLNGTSEVVTESKENGGVFEDRTILDGVDEQENRLVVEQADDKLVEEHGVDFTSGGDSVVQAVRVNLSQTGAAVVGDVEAIEESEIKGMEVPVGVSLDNEFEKISCDIEEPNESKLVALDSEPDRVVVAKSGNVEVHGKKTVAGADEVDSEKRPEREQGKLVEEHGVDFTSGGDSVVQAVRVNLSQTGAAVVGDVEAIEESEIKGMEVPVGVRLDNEFEKISCDIEEPNESKLVALDSEPDRVVVAESGNVEVHGKKTVVAGADEVDSEKRPEREQGKLVEEHGVDFTSGGDSVVQAVRVNLSQTGAAVVGDVEAIEESEIKGMEVPVGVSLDNEFEKISCDIEEPNESKLVALDSEPDRVVVAESGNVEVHGKKTVVAGADEVDFEKRPEREDELKSDSETRQNGLTREIGANEVEVVSDDILVEGNRAETLSGNCVSDLPQDEPAYEAKPGNADFSIHDQVDESETVVSGESHEPEFVEPSSTNQEIRLEEEVEEKHCTDEGGIESVEPSSILNRDIRAEAEDDDKDLEDNDGETEGSVTDGNNDGMVFGSSEAAKQFLEELERGSGTGSYSGAEGYHDHSQRIDGQIVTDSDEEVDTDEEGGGQELFDSTALAALLKAATGAASDGGNVTFTSPDGSKLFSVERPAGLGSSIRSVKPASRPNHSNLFTSSNVTVGGDSESSLTDEEKTKLEKFQQIRVKFLRLVQRLGVSTEDSIARQVLYRLALVSGRQNSHEFSLEAAKMTALQLEAEGKDDLEFSLNILVLGKAGVGKSATINSIFGEEKTPIYAFGPATTTVKEIVGVVDGIKIRVFDTPGLKSAAVEQGVNRKILSSVQKFTKKCPPDIVLYVDRLDTQSRDLNDVPILRSITSVFGTSIWRSTIVTLTHAASAPPDGPSGSPLNYELFVAQRSQILQQTIGQSVGDLRFMNPSLMSPISLVENHPSCRKNRDGQKVLPNGQSWRPQLLLLCFSMKVLSEATNLSKPQESFDHKKLFGFRSRSPPLPYLLSWLLQSRTHPKLSADQGGENADSDIDLDDLADSDQEEEEDEYDQLPSFKPLKKSQIAKLSKEQRKAYVEEYDYRVKLLQKKMWREELKRMKEMKKGKVSVDDYGYVGDEDPENGGPAAVPVPLPDMVLPPSFDGDNPAYRYRFLEPTSQFLARPVLDAQGWDHDCGYDGVNLEQSLAIANSFPAAVAVQITKDKKEFNIHLDSSVAAKHGENGSSMAGFDIQNIGKQLAYIVRGETKFKNFKKNKTTAGVSVTFLGENVSTGVKVEDQIALGKRLVLVGSTGTVRSQGDSAYGANLEVRLREADYPIGQDQSSLGLSLVKWRGDLALGANFQSQFSLGRNYKMAVRAGLNNKLSGQISIRTSSSEQLQLALVAVLPIVRSICNIIWPGVSENYSIY